MIDQQTSQHRIFTITKVPILQQRNLVPSFQKTSIFIHNRYEFNVLLFIQHWHSEVYSSTISAQYHRLTYIFTTQTFYASHQDPYKTLLGCNISLGLGRVHLCTLSNFSSLFDISFVFYLFYQQILDISLFCFL